MYVALNPGREHAQVQIVHPEQEVGIVDGRTHHVLEIAVLLGHIGCCAAVSSASVAFWLHIPAALGEPPGGRTHMKAVEYSDGIMPAAGDAQRMSMCCHCGLSSPSRLAVSSVFHSIGSSVTSTPPIAAKSACSFCIITSGGNMFPEPPVG